jgi:hypothetical protein
MDAFFDGWMDGWKKIPLLHTVHSETSNYVMER